MLGRLRVESLAGCRGIPTHPFSFRKRHGLSPLGCIGWGKRIFGLERAVCFSFRARAGKQGGSFGGDRLGTGTTRQCHCQENQGTIFPHHFLLKSRNLREQAVLLMQFTLGASAQEIEHQ